METFLKYVLPVLSIVITLGIPFIFVFKTQNIYKGMMLTWVLSIVWYFILSIPVYDILWRTNRELCIAYLPEGNTAIASIMAGWFPGLIISGLAILARKLILKFKPSLLEKRKKEAANERAGGPKVN